MLDDLFVSEDAMQERAANSAVAVGERVDGLELCVEQGGFGNRMYVFAITEAHEVIETKVQSGGVRGERTLRRADCERCLQSIPARRAIPFPLRYPP